MLPDTIDTVEQLDDLLSEPSAGVVETLARLDGDIAVLGAGGKMGPTLARMAQRASDLAGKRRRVIAISRFSNARVAAELEQHGVETFAVDLLTDDPSLTLPPAPNVVYMAGMKFGSSGHEPLTWAMNTYLPSVVCQQYQGSRIVAFSTGNVYGLTPVSGGSRETDLPSPEGEYAMSCLGRERMFAYFSELYDLPVALVRLNYAVEMRYGVLADLAAHVRDGVPIDLTMGYVNVIWQGDANAMALQLLAHTASPPSVFNVTGPAILRIRDLAETLGQLMHSAPRFTAAEAPDALLSDASRAFQLFGQPRVDIDTLLRWTAAWTLRGGETLGKPTHFEVRDGRF